VLIAAFALILLILFGYIKIQWGPQPPAAQVYVAPDGTKFDNWADYYNYFMQKWGTPPPQGSTPPNPTTREASKIQFNIHRYVTDVAVSGTTTKVDITEVVDGTVDFLKSKEVGISVSSNPTQTSLYYRQNAIIILHVLSDTDATGGTDHYDGWYWCKLNDNEQVYYFTPSCVQVISTSPTYKYQWKGGGQTTGYTVQFTSGTTPYWDIGVLYVYPRTSAANLDVYFKYRGTTLASVTDGSSFVDTVAEITANATLTSTTDDLYFEAYGGQADTDYGLPFYTVTQNGELQERKAVIIFSTAMTSIGLQTLYDNGWRTVSKSDLTAEKAFYKVIDPVIPTRGTKFTFSVKIPVDSSAASASTAYIFKIWILDCQVPSYVETGSTTTSIPTAYGFVSEYGIDAIIFNAGLTVSSGAGATNVLESYITTPA
jgi:hypothetical protein